MDTKYKVALVLAIALLSYAFGRYAQPAKEVIKTETVIKEVVVDHHDVVTHTHEVKNPDGTIITDTDTKDKSEVDSNSSSDNKTSVTITNNKPQWKVQALLVPTTGQGLAPLYGASIERRILGPIFVGAWGNTDKKFGASLSLEF